MARPATTKQELLHQLNLGLVAETADRDLLIEMGFAPLYPQIRDGYHEHLWGRQVAARTSAGGCLQLAIERAVLVAA